MEVIHTCYRVIDLERSRRFYTALGFEARGTLGIGTEATNLYLGLPGDGDRVELTCNHGREEPYELGTGYGHIAMTVRDLDATLGALAEQGITPERAPYRVNDSGSSICFVRDPDGYRIELIEEGDGDAAER
jgi:lactoylglutathione lyase